MTFAPAGMRDRVGRADRFDATAAHEDDLVADDSAVGHVDETPGADRADSGLRHLDSAGERAPREHSEAAVAYTYLSFAFCCSP